MLKALKLSKHKHEKERNDFRIELKPLTSIRRDSSSLLGVAQSQVGNWGRKSSCVQGDDVDDEGNLVKQ